MHSRAHMLLEKQLFKTTKEELPWGIKTGPFSDDDMFVWEATIKGPKDTMWEGGIFKLYLQFGEEYSCGPPKVFFHTIPFHPNVNPNTGEPCVDFLDNLNDWEAYYSIPYILLSIQIMLDNPVTEGAVNMEATQMYLNSPSLYRQTVLDCVLASKRVDAGLKPHISPTVDVTQTATKEQEKAPEEEKKPPKRMAKISFEDYHAVWSGIATTKPVADWHNPLNDVLKDDTNLQAAHFGVPQKELQEEIEKQMAEHNSLMYGKFTNGKNAEDGVELKASKIQLLRQIYMPGKSQGQPSSHYTASTAPSPSFTTSKDTDYMEPSEHEVEQLLAWSSNLQDEQAEL